MSQQSVSKRELTRAEQVRARRQAEQNRQRKTSRPSQPKTQARPSETIQNQTSGNVFARPVGKPSHQMHKLSSAELTKPSVSKRITIPLNKQGAEIQFSTFPVTKMGWRIVSALIAAAMLAGMIVMSVTMRVETITIDGLSTQMASEANLYLGLSGKPIYMIQPAKIGEELQRGFPEVKSTSVSVKFPNQVTVSVDARQPIYAWVLKDEERLFLIDDEGVLYPAEPDATTDGLIVIEAGSLPDSKIEFEESDDILIEIISYVDPYTETTTEANPADRGDSYVVDPTVIHALEQILLHIPDEAQLIYHYRHGFGWTDDQGWNAYFGLDLEKIDMKIAVYNSIVNYIAYQGLDVSLISVEYLHEPYYRED